MPQENSLRVSVVVLTYNGPQALQLVLKALARQSRLPLEVIVSDDGSRSDTAACIVAAATDFPVPLVHLWQPDEGSRMSRARNRGIAAARGDYIVFIDGDMVAHHHFIADHVRYARRGCFNQGSRVLTSQACSGRMIRDQQIDLSWFEPGIERRRHTIRWLALATLAARPKLSMKGIKSCNWGFWRDDLLAINGFNETMRGWGREDEELAVRAFNLGLLRRDLRFAGLAIHLWHATRKNLIDNPNDAILARTCALGLVRCEQGLSCHLDELATVPAD